MSSLTSIGVNKNKKSFAPKKRKERKTPAVTQPAPPPPPPITHDQQETSEIKFAHLVREAQESGKPIPTIHPTNSLPVSHGIPQIPTVSTKPSTHIPLPTVSPSYFPQTKQPPVTAPSPGAVLPKQEPLTEEEMAINAFSRRARQRPTATAITATTTTTATTATSVTSTTASQTLVSPSSSIPIITPASAIARATSEDTVKIKQLPRTTPGIPSTPIDAPSPIAPIERPDCTYENEDFTPQLKIERMTPEVRIKLSQGETTPSSTSIMPPPATTRPSPSTPSNSQKNHTPTQPAVPEPPLVDPKTPKQDLEEQESQTAALLAAAAIVNEMDDIGQNDYMDEDYDTYDGQNSGNRHVLHRDESDHSETQDIDVGSIEPDFQLPEANRETTSKRKQPENQSAKKKESPRKRQRKAAAVSHDDKEYEDTIASSSRDVVSGLPSSRRAKARAAQVIAEADLGLSEGETESSDEEDRVPVRKPTTKSKPANGSRSTPAIKPKQTKDKGKGKATAITPKSTSKGAPISISIGVPGQPNPTANDKDASETSEGEDEAHRTNGKKRKRKAGVAIDKPDPYAYRRVKNMRTLDDITEDPSLKINVEKPMIAFTRDIDGVVSKTFKEMEIQRESNEKKEEAKKNMSVEELDALRKKEEAEEAEMIRKKEEEKEQREAERLRREAEGQVLTESSNALQVRIVNGEIVLDTDTLTVERSAPESTVNDGMLEIVEENSMTRKVNSHTYGRRQKSSRWDDLETEAFYDCLSQFGTDFEMIAMMMPGRTRSQIRLKYNREERLHPDKVTEYMIRKRKPMDIEKYKEMAGIDTLEAVPEDFHEMQLG
ncbi:hypothetical protein EDC96DRAFT_562368 [Choanephora cucurbitarum]|nr:hypothetical protein EDC96DRAFT_562368 [Choanephora cucurbitarum]